MLDFDALHVFYCVGKAGGIGAAARELSVTQAAVSQRMKSLEKQLGRKLHGRAGQKLILTEDGQRLFQTCRPHFEVLRTVEASLDHREVPLLGAIRVASLSEFAKAFLFPTIHAFHRKHPAVEFDITYRHPYEMMDFLRRHEVDFAFTNELYRKPQVESIPGFREEIVCVGRGPSRRLSWKEIGELPWLACGSEDNVWYEFERMASKRGARLSHPKIQVAEMESILMLAALGVGYTLAPIHALKIRPLKGLAVHRLPAGPFSRMIYFCRLRTVPLGKAAKTFWDFLLARAPIR